MLKPLLFLMLLMISTSNFAENTPLTIESLFSGFAQIESERKNFTEEQLDPILEIRTQKSGYLIYQSPNSLTLHYLTPIKGSISFTPHQIKIDFPQRTLIFSPENAPQLAFSQALLHLLNGNLNQLSNNFTLQLLPQLNQRWQLNLTPKREHHKDLHPIQIQGVQQQITEISITTQSGELRKISFEPSLTP